MLKVRQRHLTSINYYTQIGTNAMQMLISIICKFGGQWYANLMVNDMKNERDVMMVNSENGSMGSLIITRLQCCSSLGHILVKYS